MLKDQKI